MLDNARAPDISPSFKRSLPWLLAYLPLSVLFTWPLTAHLTTRLAGNHGDSWQNLWNLVWLRRSLYRGENLFYTRDLWHPEGATLVFQTFDLPDLLPAALLVGPLHPWTVYNLVVLWTFAASGAAMFLFARCGLGASRPAAFFAGCAYTFSTYHFAHSLGHLHIQAMQWVPLYALALLRTLERRSWRWALGAGGLLVVVSLGSWYSLAGAFLISAPLVLLHALREERGALPSLAARLLLLCATYLVLIAPLGRAMLEERAKEPIAGAHDARTFSADLESFVVPNRAQALSAFTPRFERWKGNTAENGTYLGLMLLGLVGAGACLKAPRTRGLLLVALVGLVASLGPRLLVGGEPVTGDVLPYALVERWVPLLSFMGVPVRFAFAATFALAAALAPSLDAIADLKGWKVAGVLALLAVAEHTPRAFVTSANETPAPMLAWADDPEPFVVLDATRDSRQLWHQAVHGKPIFGGYLTRTPARLEKMLEADPVAGPLLSWHPPVRRVPLVLGTLDFPYGREIVPWAERERFSFEVRGSFEAEKSGDYTFFVESDDGSELFIDGRRIVDNSGEHGAIEKSGTVRLAEGRHELRLSYRQARHGHMLRVHWQGPDSPRRVLEGEWRGSATLRRRELGLAREAALEHLKSLGVRYIVQDTGDSRFALESELGLVPSFESRRTRIYTLPE